LPFRDRDRDSAEGAEALRPDTDNAATDYAGAHPDFVSPVAVLALQRSAGNRLVSAALGVSRAPVPEAPAPAYAPAPAQGPGGAAPAWATEDLRRKMSAVILAEAGPGQEDDVRWIYLTRVTEAKGEAGLEGSSAYDQGIRYRLYLYTLGDPKHGNDPLPAGDPQFKGFTTVADYCSRNAWWKKERAPRAARLRTLVDEMLVAPEANPYPGWIGQGSLNDFNNVDNPGDMFWTRARAYYWLQERGEVKETLVKILPAKPPGKLITVLHDANSILAYFTANPDKLPANVPLYER
jgi:hypothetical protein